MSFADCRPFQNMSELLHQPASACIISILFEVCDRTWCDLCRGIALLRMLRLPRVMSSVKQPGPMAGGPRPSHTARLARCRSCAVWDIMMSSLYWVHLRSSEYHLSESNMCRQLMCAIVRLCVISSSYLSCTCVPFCTHFVRYCIGCHEMMQWLQNFLGRRAPPPAKQDPTSNLLLGV